MPSCPCRYFINKYPLLQDFFRSSSRSFLWFSSGVSQEVFQVINLDSSPNHFQKFLHFWRHCSPKNITKISFKSFFLRFFFWNSRNFKRNSPRNFLMKFSLKFLNKFCKTLSRGFPKKFSTAKKISEEIVLLGFGDFLRISTMNSLEIIPGTFSEIPVDTSSAAFAGVTPYSQGSSRDFLKEFL